MAKENLNIEQLLEVVDASYQPFVQSLHNYLIDSGCKVTVEDKKSGYFASYKHVHNKNYFNRTR